MRLTSNRHVGSNPTHSANAKAVLYGLLFALSERVVFSPEGSRFTSFSPPARKHSLLHRFGYRHRTSSELSLYPCLFRALTNKLLVPFFLFPKTILFSGAPLLCLTRRAHPLRHQQASQTKIRLACFFTLFYERYAHIKVSETALKNSMIFMRRRMMAEYPPKR